MPSSPLDESSAKRTAILRVDFPVDAAADATKPSDIARKSLHIFVSAPRNVQDQQRIFFHLWRAANQFGQRVSRFERRNNPFRSRQSFCRGNRFVVSDRGIF